jgi:Flp pilus assembly protein TadB
VTGVLLLGVLFGAGVVTVVAWAFPARPALAEAFAALHPPVTTPAPQPVLPAPPDRGWLAVLGRPVVPLLARTGLPRQAVLADLTVCGRDPARHLAEQGALALLAFLTMPALAAILALAGAGIGWQLPVWAGLLAAALGLFSPDLALASEARKRRAELRDAVAGMLDLVAIALAGGAGVEQALRDATDAPDSWAQQALRQAVEAAHLTRRPPWQTIGDLGEVTAVTALQELSAALSLAGSEGARIRATLSARSAALSAHQLAEAESTAVSATEAMVLPVVVLLAGFLIFIGYPAFAAVMTALHT